MSADTDARAATITEDIIAKAHAESDARHKDREEIAAELADEMMPNLPTMSRALLLSYLRCAMSSYQVRVSVRSLEEHGCKS